MKKLFLPIFLFFSIFTFSPQALSIAVYIDQQELTFDVPPVIENGTTLVPMRAIFENLGATVDWDEKTATITGQKDDRKVSLTLNQKIAYINQEAFSLNVPVKTIQNRTMVPLRFISESFHCQVDWDSNTKVITIQSKENVSEENKEETLYTVVRVVDGDTIVIDNNGTQERVRLIGIDTPESVHPNQDKNTPYGKIASDFTKEQLTGKQVSLEFDVQERDKYGRLLAYVYLDGKMFNKTLLEKGHAVVATFPPNVKYVSDFQAIQEKAQDEQVGVWKGYVKEEIKTSGNFVGSKNSNKYHKPDCRFAKTIAVKNQIWFDTIEEAENAGYTPCGTCN